MERENLLNLRFWKGYFFYKRFGNNYLYKLYGLMILDIFYKIK